MHRAAVRVTVTQLELEHLETATAGEAHLRHWSKLPPPDLSPHPLPPRGGPAAPATLLSNLNPTLASTSTSTTSTPRLSTAPPSHSYHPQQAPQPSLPPLHPRRHRCHLRLPCRHLVACPTTSFRPRPSPFPSPNQRLLRAPSCRELPLRPPRWLQYAFAPHSSSSDLSALSCDATATRMPLCTRTTHADVKPSQSAKANGETENLQHGKEARIPPLGRPLLRLTPPCVGKIFSISGYVCTTSARRCTRALPRRRR